MFDIPKFKFNHEPHTFVITWIGKLEEHDFFLLFRLRGYWHCGHSWSIVPASGDNEDDYGEADGM
jgi:hypothetical protein